MEEKLLTPAEVADIRKISRGTAYTMLKRGEISSMRIGALVRIRQSDLERYLNETGNKKNSGRQSRGV